MSAPESADGLLFTHAAQLLTLAGAGTARRGAAMSDLGLVRDGAVLTRGDRIAAAGPTDAVLRQVPRAPATITEIDCRGMLLAPGLVDAHTHLVFAGPRLDDYERRLRGESYAQIAAAGGGIAVSVRGVRQAPAAALLQGALRRLVEARDWGTTTLEAKTGYGLELAAERKSLEIAAAAGARLGMDVPRTFLGAHIVPPEFAADREAYLAAVIEGMLPAFTAPAAAAWAPEFIDVFCDPGAFSAAECRRVLEAGRRRRLKLKLHADQFECCGGLELALELGATSVDHLDAIDAAGACRLAAAPTVAVLLPGAAFFIGRPWPPARALIAAGAAVALASDCNPGTCPIVSLPTIMALACSGMGMSPAEAWTAVTVNAAAALDRAARCGSLAPGRRADVAVFEVDDYRAVPYFAGANLCRGAAVAGCWHARGDRAGIAEEMP